MNEIFEDNPLPYEIKNVYFCLHREGDYFYLSFGGSELPLKTLFSFEFYPLDAQFFDIYYYCKNFTLHDLKILLQKAIKNKYFKILFQNVQIFFGVFMCEEIYMLEK